VAGFELWRDVSAMAMDSTLDDDESECVMRCVVGFSIADALIVLSVSGSQK